MFLLNAYTMMLLDACVVPPEQPNQDKEYSVKHHAMKHPNKY